METMTAATSFPCMAGDLLLNVVDDPGVMTVHADSAFRSVADVLRAVREKPRSPTVGPTGIGSDDHLAMLLLKRQAGVKLTPAPFSGSAENYRAMIGCRIRICDRNPGEGSRGAAGVDPVRMLGVMSRTRWEMAPDLPAFRKQGYAIDMVPLRIVGPEAFAAELMQFGGELRTPWADMPWKN